jgi:putative ABC transport system ATP-binding protein
VLENVEITMEYNIGARVRRERAKNLLSCVGLADRQSDIPKRLSRVEQQRVAIIRALANEPLFLLADEPAENLNGRDKSGILGLLKTLNKNGTTIVMATRDESAEEYASKVIRIDDGILV